VTLRVDSRAELPPLAWLLELAGADERLVCGSSVNVGHDAFIEGAWAGPFEDWAFDVVRDVFGSGGRRTASGWLVVPPSHTLECVFLIRLGGRGWVASNSLPFLRAWTGATFVLPSRRLALIFVRIVDGIGESPIRVETTAGTLYALYHHNCLLTADGFDLRPKPLPPRFESYAAYVAHLAEAVSQVASNADSPQRRHTYPLLATLSSGYDSPACAVLAKRAGCDEAFTFTSARSGASDDGTRIAEYLGLGIATVERPADLHDLGEAELEFLATGMHAEEAHFAAASALLEQRILVSGMFGGLVWDLRHPPTSVLRRADNDGTSLGEFRLARDFVHMPVPFVGALQHGDLDRISRSAEMQPYRLERQYDRPIPRRIVEEAGVPREYFGQSKEAVSMLVFLDDDLLSPQTRQAVQERVAGFGLLERAAYRLQSARFRLGVRCYELTKGWPRARAVLERIFRREAICEHMNPAMGVAFEYALSKVSRRYRSETR
jgi:hypothetical protein